MFLPGTAFIDVGVNIGNQSVFLAAILNAPVHAFEPFPPNHASLELYIAAIGLDGEIIASQYAIGETSGVATLHPGQPGNFGTTPTYLFSATDQASRT